MHKVRNPLVICQSEHEFSLWTRGHGRGAAAPFALSEAAWGRASWPHPARTPLAFFRDRLMPYAAVMAPEASFRRRLKGDEWQNLESRGPGCILRQRKSALEEGGHLQPILQKSASMSVMRANFFEKTGPPGGKSAHVEDLRAKSPPRIAFDRWKLECPRR